MDRNLRRPKSRSLRTNRGFIDWRELSNVETAVGGFQYLPLDHLAGAGHYRRHTSGRRSHGATRPTSGDIA
jgi:hypothetical protein